MSKLIFTDQERTGRNLAEHGSWHGSQLKTESIIMGGRSSQSDPPPGGPKLLAQGLHAEWYLIRTLPSEISSDPPPLASQRPVHRHRHIWRHGHRPSTPATALL